MHTDTDLPEWVPPSGLGAVWTLPAGRWWDAVEVDSWTAIYVIGRIEGLCGPVVEDWQHATGTARWLVPVGSAAGWGLPGARVLGLGDEVAVPPLDWSFGPWPGRLAIHWLIPPTGAHLADPESLRPALTRALANRQAVTRHG